MNDTPFPTHGDDALEARIVSWVLGEASAFEAAELERLCEERPELLVFKRRMQTLHGLLVEAETSQPDEDWKLPEEKRRALDELFGDAAVPQQDVEKDCRVNRSGRRALLAIAACVVITILIGRLLVPAAIQKSKKLQPSEIVSTEMRVSKRMESDESDSDRLRAANPPEVAEMKLEKGEKSDLAIASPPAVPMSSPALLEAPVVPEVVSKFDADSRVVLGGNVELEGAARPATAVPKDAANGGFEPDGGAMAVESTLARRDEMPRYAQSHMPASGAGWGATNMRDDSSIVAGNRSGDSAITRNPIDSILNDSDRAVGAKETEGQPELRELKQAAELSETSAASDGFKVARSTLPGEPAVAVDSLTGKTVIASGKIVFREMNLSGPAADMKPGASGTTGSEAGQEMSARIVESSDPGELAKAIRDQEDKLEERRKVLATIVRTKGIIYKGQDSFYGGSGVDEDAGAKTALQARDQLQQEKIQLESQISGLLKYKDDQLMTYASGLDLPDNSVKVLYPRFQEKKRELETLKVGGVGEDHPRFKAAANELELVKQQLDQGVANLRESLNGMLDLTGERLKNVEAFGDEGRAEAIRRGLDSQDYVDAKRDFEKDQILLQQMKQRLEEVSSMAKPESPEPDLDKRFEETSTAEDPFSTFSLNVSDASFQVARAAIAKGERPDAASVKVEQFYNAVDYGDPSPAAGEPVSMALGQCGHPMVPGRNLVRIALKTAAAGRSAAQPLRLTLLVDQSGSMVREDRREAMDKALADLGSLLTAKDVVNVIGFSRTPRLLADALPGDKAGNLAALVNQSAGEGGTNLEEALRLGEQLALRSRLNGARNRIVLFTDGAANLGNDDPAKLAEKVRKLRQKGIAFDIAGIAADGLNDELLGELARHGDGRYHVVGKAGDGGFARQLAGAFSPAAENVKVQVRFNPERVARYRLIGFEKDRLRTEDFRNDAVDAAELAAEEAGVAIYQVEPLPGGKGEIGEVSVRFLEVASQRIVERSWTIPHDSAVPVLDRAAPSMQLAVLSMLAAEKLKGGPLADAIDFNQLAHPAAAVRRHYGDEGRPAEMLRLIEALK